MFYCNCGTCALIFLAKTDEEQPGKEWSWHPQCIACEAMVRQLLEGYVYKLYT